MKKLLLLIAVLGLSASNLPAQTTEDVPFNGLITNADGQGIKARISVKNTDKYTIANKKGQFGLTNVAATDTLVIKYKRNNIELPVAGRKSLKIVWSDGDALPQYSEDKQLVDDGFGYIKRREYTSASSGLSGDDMVKKGFTDLQSAIAALCPGVRLFNGELTIRGINSINLSSKPLIICNGTPIEDLNSINIHDVATVEVQKGSNMYGVRGANGVIIIRTK